MYTRWDKSKITVIHTENNIIINKIIKHSVNSVFHALTTVSLLLPCLILCKHCLYRSSVYLSIICLSISGPQAEFLREGDTWTEFQKEKSYIRHIKKKQRHSDLTTGLYYYAYVYTIRIHV